MDLVALQPLLAQSITWQVLLRVLQLASRSRNPRRHRTKLIIAVHNLCRRLKVLFKNEHHARVLKMRFAPRSRFELLEVAILVDVAHF